LQLFTVRCTTDVYMEYSKRRAFTKGNVYDCYVEDTSAVIVVVEDDRGHEHEISDHSGVNDTWFKQHFEVVDDQTDTDSAWNRAMSIL